MKSSQIFGLLIFLILHWSQRAMGAEATTATYTVHLKMLNPAPPSCEVISRRLRSQLVRLSEVDYILDKVDSGEILSSTESESLKAVTQQLMPGVFDRIDQEVKLTVKWTLNSNPFYAYLFSKFKIQGPGIKWESHAWDDTIPAFLHLNISSGSTVEVSYQVPILDFCYAENQIILRGKLKEELSPKDPILKATWKRDVLISEQYGAKFNFNLGVKK